MIENSSSLEFKNVTFGYNKQNLVLSNISFVAKNSDTTQFGHVTAIMGNSGAGKSTILNLLLGITKNFEGEIITYPKEPVISYVPQNPELFEHLTPMQNAKYFENISNYKSKYSSKLFDELVNTLDLIDVLKAKYVYELSGGQKQRLMLLRALSIRPNFLLLDEPCTGLDAEGKMQFLYKLRQLVKEYDLFVIYITHHQDEAKIIADDIIYLTKDPKTNSVSTITKGTITEFIEKTPTIESAKVFQFPDLNIVRFKTIDNIIHFSDNINDHQLAIKSNEIIFNNSEGYKFKIIANSAIYTQIKLEETETTLIVQNASLKDYSFCTFNGKCNEYDSAGYFLRQIHITDNKIENK